MRTQVATMAKKPRMTMTAIAQSGKSESLEFGWTAPGLPGLLPVPSPSVAVAEGSEAEEPEEVPVDEGLGEAVDEASMIDVGRLVWMALKTA